MCLRSLVRDLRTYDLRAHAGERGNNPAAIARYDRYMTAKNFEDFFASGGTTADLLYDLGRGYCVVARATLDAEWRAYKGDSPPAAAAGLEAAPPVPERALSDVVSL